MKIMRPTLIDLLQLAAQARDDERAQYEALVGEPWHAENVAHHLYGRIGHKFGLYGDDGTPIAVGGWDPVLDGVWQAWMIGSDEGWTRHWFPITRAARRVMRTLFNSDGARRLQVNVLESRVKACEWYVRGLGMTHEGTMRGFGVNGENVATFARLKEDRHGRW
jgi:hypothetical protein